MAGPAGRGSAVPTGSPPQIADELLPSRGQSVDLEPSFAALDVAALDLEQAGDDEALERGGDRALPHLEGLDHPGLR